MKYLLSTLLFLLVMPQIAVIERGHIAAGGELFLSLVPAAIYLIEREEKSNR